MIASRMFRSALPANRTRLASPKLLYFALAVVAAVVAALSGHDASAQTTRTIKIVVPVPAGGGTDFVARLLGEQISRARGLTVLIENRPGANGVIATEAVARAAPDGNTLLMPSGAFVIHAHLRKLNYDPLTSFEPICQLVSVPALIAVNSESPYRTLGELLDTARTNPGNLTLATSLATEFHIGFEILKRTARVDMTFIPYPGAAPAVTALLGQHVTSVFYGYPGLVDQLRSGKLRALATGSRTRIASLPDVPTVAESGYKDYEVDFWYGVIAPANTPKDAVAQLADWFTTAIRTPEVIAKLDVQGIYPAGICGAKFGALIRKEFDEFGRVIREANIKATE